MQIRLNVLMSIGIFVVFLVVVIASSSQSFAQNESDQESISVQRQINFPENRRDRNRRPKGGDESVRNIDGSNNNRNDEEMGAAHTNLL